jgi:hypothetical protein
MTNEPKLAPEAPASDATNEAAKSATGAKPIVTPVPDAKPPADEKKI